MSDSFVGQRLVVNFDAYKTVKTKDGDKEIEGQRLYQLSVPYGCPFEEVYEALNLIQEEVKKIEAHSKEEAKKKEEQKDLEEASKN